MPETLHSMPFDLERTHVPHYVTRTRTWPTSALPDNGPRALPPAGGDARTAGVDAAKHPQQSWMPRQPINYTATIRTRLEPPPLTSPDKAQQPLHLLHFPDQPIYESADGVYAPKHDLHRGHRQANTSQPARHDAIVPTRRSLIKMTMAKIASRRPAGRHEQR